MQLSILRWGEWSLVVSSRLWVPLLGAGLVAAAWLLCQAGGKHKRRAAWERERRAELEAYCLLELTLPVQGLSQKLTDRAKRVCRLITGKSVFAKAALFVADVEGRLQGAGSCGMDDLTLQELARWGERIQEEEHARVSDDGTQPGDELARSFPVILDRPERPEEREELDTMSAQGCHTATMVPIRLHRGRLVGLLAVCAPRQPLSDAQGERMHDAVVSLELLAAKLARTAERTLLMERLIEVERLAGAGHLVAGVAEEMSRPLNTVLDCSELIAGTAAEARIREHAETAVREAHAMREVLHTLRHFWRPRVDAGRQLEDRRRQRR